MAHILLSVGFPFLILVIVIMVMPDTQTVHIDSITSISKANVIVTCLDGEERERQETRGHARSLQGQRFVTWTGAGNTTYKINVRNNK